MTCRLRDWHLLVGDGARSSAANAWGRRFFTRYWYLAAILAETQASCSPSLRARTASGMRMNLHVALVKTAQVMESGTDSECSTYMYGSNTTTLPVPPHLSQHAEPLHHGHGVEPSLGRVRKNPERPEPLQGWCRSRRTSRKEHRLCESWSGSGRLTLKRCGKPQNPADVPFDVLLVIAIAESERLALGQIVEAAYRVLPCELAQHVGACLEGGGGVNRELDCHPVAMPPQPDAASGHHREPNPLAALAPAVVGNVPDGFLDGIGQSDAN